MYNKIQQKDRIKRDNKIRLMYANTGITLRDIAKIYGISYERVRQIIEKPKVDKSQKQKTYQT